MTATESCPACAGVRTLDSSPGGHCPRCLLELGLSADEAQREGLPLSRSDRQLGRFRIVGLAGRGPHGVVYEAYDDDNGARVALKVLMHRGESRRDDLVAGAWIAGELKHPRVIDVLASGTQDGLRYLVLDWLEGGSLEAWFAGQRSRAASIDSDDVGRTVRWMTDAARGLNHLHVQGMAHGNLKPGNLLLDGNAAVRLSDLGRPVTVDALPPPPADRPLASVGYCAPELLGWDAANPRGDPRGDVYSLGAVCYELLTGTLPYDAVDEEAYLDAIGTGRSVALRTRRRDVPRTLDRLVMRCLAPDPADRFPGAGPLLDELESLPVRSGLFGRAAAFLRRRRP